MTLIWVSDNWRMLHSYWSHTIKHYSAFCMTFEYQESCMWAFLVAQVVKKKSSCNVGDLGSILGKISWRRAWQPNSSVLAWRIPWTEEPGVLQSWDRKESDTTEWLSLSVIYVDEKLIYKYLRQEPYVGEQKVFLHSFKTHALPEVFRKYNHCKVREACIFLLNHTNTTVLFCICRCCLKASTVLSFLLISPCLKIYIMK